MPCRYHSGSWLRRPQRIYLPGARRRALATCAQGPRGHSSRSLTPTRQAINPPSGYLSRRHGPGMPAAASAGTAVSWHAACLVHVVSWAHVPLAPPGGWLACGLQPGVVLYVLLELGNHLLGQCAAGLRDPAQDVRRRGEILAVLEDDPLEHQLRGPAGGELDVGGGEQPGPVDDRRHVHVLVRVRHRGQVPVPDRLPGLLVGRPYLIEIVKPAIEQESDV